MYAWEGGAISDTSLHPRFSEFEEVEQRSVHDARDEMPSLSLSSIPTGKSDGQRRKRIIIHLVMVGNGRRQSSVSKC